jgi:hypothetical protein
VAELKQGRSVKRNVPPDQAPLEEGVAGVGWKSQHGRRESRSARQAWRTALTTGDVVDRVLDEEVDER